MTNAVSYSEPVLEDRSVCQVCSVRDFWSACARNLVVISGQVRVVLVDRAGHTEAAEVEQAIRHAFGYCGLVVGQATPAYEDPLGLTVVILARQMEVVAERALPYHHSEA